MDNYKEECKACWCKQAQKMMYNHDVWFNCNSCPFTECYEPDTREQYLSGITEREAEYKRFEEREKLRKMEEEEYKRTPHYRSVSSFAVMIRKKIERNEVLYDSELANAIRLCDTRDAYLLDFYSATDLIMYQLSSLGYKAAAKEIVEYINNVEAY